MAFVPEGQADRSQARRVPGLGIDAERPRPEYLFSVGFTARRALEYNSEKRRVPESIARVANTGWQIFRHSI